MSFFSLPLGFQFISQQPYPSLPNIQSLYSSLFDFRSPSIQQRALEYINTFRSRSFKLPVGIDLTAMLIHCQLLDAFYMAISTPNADEIDHSDIQLNFSTPNNAISADSTTIKSTNLALLDHDQFHPSSMTAYTSTPSLLTPHIVRYFYSLTIIRLVNGLVDSLQTNGKFAIPIHKLAKSIKLPRELVDLRHEATHNELPNLASLRKGAQLGLFWLHQQFWTPLLTPSLNLIQTSTTLIHQARTASLEYSKALQKLYNSTYPSCVSVIASAVYHQFPTTKQYNLQITRDELAPNPVNLVDHHIHPIHSSNTDSPTYADTTTLELEIGPDFSKECGFISEFHFPSFISPHNNSRHHHHTNHAINDPSVPTPQNHTPQLNKIYSVRQQFTDTPWITSPIIDATTLPLPNKREIKEHPRLQFPPSITFSAFFHRQMEQQLLSSLPMQYQTHPPPTTSSVQANSTIQTPHSISTSQPPSTSPFRQLYGSCSYDNFHLPDPFDEEEEEGDIFDENMDDSTAQLNSFDLDQLNSDQYSMNDLGESSYYPNPNCHDSALLEHDEQLDHRLDAQIDHFSHQLWQHVVTHPRNEVFNTPHYAHLFFNKQHQLFSIPQFFTDFTHNCAQLSSTYNSIGKMMDQRILDDKRYRHISLVKIPKKAFDPYSITPPPPPMTVSYDLFANFNLPLAPTQPSQFPLQPIQSSPSIDPTPDHTTQPHNPSSATHTTLPPPFLHFSPHFDSLAFFAQFQWLYDFILAILEPNTPLPGVLKTDKIREAKVDLLTSPLESVLTAHSAVATSSPSSSSSILTLPCAVSNAFSSEMDADMLTKKEAAQLAQIERKNMQFQTAYTSLSRLILPRFTQKVNRELSTGAIKSAIEQLIWDLYPDPAQFLLINTPLSPNLPQPPQYHYTIPSTGEFQRNHRPTVLNNNDITGVKRPLIPLEGVDQSSTSTSSVSANSITTAPSDYHLNTNSTSTQERTQALKRQKTFQTDSFIEENLFAALSGNFANPQPQTESSLQHNESVRFKVIVPTEFDSNNVKIHRPDELFSVCFLIYTSMVEICTQIMTSNVTTLNQIVKDKSRQAPNQKSKATSKGQNAATSQGSQQTQFSLIEAACDTVVDTIGCNLDELPQYISFNCTFLNEVTFDNHFDLQSQIDFVKATGCCRIDEEDIDKYIEQKQIKRLLPHLPKKETPQSKHIRKQLAAERVTYKTKTTAAFTTAHQHFTTLTQLLSKLSSSASPYLNCFIQSPLDLFTPIGPSELHQLRAPLQSPELAKSTSISCPNHLLTTLIPPLLAISTTPQRSGILGWPADPTTTPPNETNVKKVHQQLYSQWSPFLTALCATYPGFQQQLIISLLALLLRIDWCIMSNPRLVVREVEFESKKSRSGEKIDKTNTNLNKTTKDCGTVSISHIEMISELPPVSTLIRPIPHKCIPKTDPKTPNIDTTITARTNTSKDITSRGHQLHPQHQWIVSIIVEWILSLVIPFVPSALVHNLSFLSFSHSITFSPHTVYSSQFPHHHATLQQLQQYAIDWNYILFLLSTHSRNISTAPPALKPSNVNQDQHHMGCEQSYVLPLLLEKLSFLHSSFKTINRHQFQPPMDNHHNFSDSIVSISSTNRRQPLSRPCGILFGL